MKLYWYNPENDMALAAGVANYTPTRAAQVIRRAGSFLPVWYGDNGDVVLSDVNDIEWMHRIHNDFGIDMALWSPDITGLHPDPWGWSLYAANHYTKHNVSADDIPDGTDIARIRELSHRRTSAIVASKLLEMMPDAPLTPSATECRTMADVTKLCSVYQKTYAKMPWSSSGRGVLCSSDVASIRFMKFCEDSIRRQGSVMIEPAQDKVLDFARLYECAGGKCTELGTSVFSTDSRGAYTGNLLMPEDMRLQHVARYLTIEIVIDASRALNMIIEQYIAPHYDGVVGVDMLVTCDRHLDAVVEINLRKTMGYVANTFADKYMAEGAIGLLRSMPLRGNETPKANYTTVGGKISTGILPLSPPTPEFAFVAQL